MRATAWKLYRYVSRGKPPMVGSHRGAEMRRVGGDLVYRVGACRSET